MTEFTQENRWLTLTTPLGRDVLLPISLHGAEEISRLFSFELELATPLGTPVSFDRILGQSVTVELRQTEDAIRHFNGIVTKFSACGRDVFFAYYRATVAPSVWRLTRTRRCRVFQHLSTPDILRRVLDGFDVAYKLVGTYLKRNYCVQYQESDFDFASRLMEEDGIHYAFTHAPDGHQMVLSDSASPHRRIGGGRGVTLGETADRAKDWEVSEWRTTQQLRSGRFVLRDHCFQTPDDPLEVAQACLDEVKLGRATHKLRLTGADRLELYEFPGGYAKRHDKVGTDGGAQEPDLGGMFEDRDRMVRLRIEAEECAALRIEGRGNCGLFAAGATFDLLDAGNAAGTYLLTRVEHVAHNGGWRAGEAAADSYDNRFVCLPAALRFCPARVTPRPSIAGVQTATVVGPGGAEMFCDRYGRVKVQFPWDREGRHDAESSCWLRVAQVWAGAGWGAFFWPRIGHEVVVAFENGDPDCPLIVGSVYNAANMPPYAMPARQELGGIRSASVRGAARHNFNSVVFNDEKGSEHLSIHSERNLSLNSEYDKMINAGRHKGERVANSSVQAVGTLPSG